MIRRADEFFMAVNFTDARSLIENAQQRPEWNNSFNLKKLLSQHDEDIIKVTLPQTTLYTVAVSM